MSNFVEECLNLELWHACAGGMVQIPPLNSTVCYFPQGHAEHAVTTVDFGALPRIRPTILCRVAALKYSADPETDEVFVNMGLVPLGENDHVCVDDAGVLVPEPGKRPASFAKKLTQSDANNGGGFSVPRFCADNIFPPLDYLADPPLQYLVAKDVHGRRWTFRHIYRGTPRRHLLTTGWSTFVNNKKLIAGDSIVFLKEENGDLCVGVRRARTSRGGGRVKPESVVEAAVSAANGLPFEVVFYPGANLPEFCVRASSVDRAMRMQWYPGMRFKMPSENKESFQTSWFLGSVAAAQDADPIRWPDSPWRRLRVTWDDQDQLQDVTCVNPWLVELVSNMPSVHLLPFSPPRKKLRLTHEQHFPSNIEIPTPTFSGCPLYPITPFYFSSENFPVGLQEARHAQVGFSSLDVHLSDKLQMAVLTASSIPRLDPQTKIVDIVGRSDAESDENVSCLLSIGNSNEKSEKSGNTVKPPQFILFGQPIYIKQQTLEGESCEVAAAQNSSNNSVPSPQDLPRINSTAQSLCNQGVDSGRGQLLVESEDVCRTLDQSVLPPYDEL